MRSRKFDNISIWNVDMLEMFLVANDLRKSKSYKDVFLKGYLLKRILYLYQE